MWLQTAPNTSLCMGCGNILWGISASVFDIGGTEMLNLNNMAFWSPKHGGAIERVTIQVDTNTCYVNG